MAITPLIYDDQAYIMHGDGRSFDFLNDLGVDIPAGTPVVLGDSGLVAFAKRDIADQAIGTLHIDGGATIWQAPYDGGDDVAVGDLLSIDPSTGGLKLNTSGTGLFVALPKQAAGIEDSAAAATEDDTAILVVQTIPGGAGGGGSGDSTITLVTADSGNTLITHDATGSGAPSLSAGTNAVTLTVNGNKILSLEFVGDSSGGGAFTITHNTGKTPNVRAFNNGTGVQASPTVTRSSGNALAISGLTNSTTYRFHLDF